MWSIANEPRTHLPDAGIYFEEVAEHVRNIDLSRPITIALNYGVDVCVCVHRTNHLPVSNNDLILYIFIE